MATVAELAARARAANERRKNEYRVDPTTGRTQTRIGNNWVNVTDDAARSIKQRTGIGSDRYSVPTPPSSSSRNRTSIMDVVGAPQYDPSRYRSMDEYVADVNRYMADIYTDAEGVIRNRRTGQVYGIEERESGPNYVRNTGRILPVSNVPTPPTQTLPGANVPYASLEYERAQRERAMNEAINRLRSDYERLNQNIQQDRTLENLQLARNLNPFSGRSDYAWGMVNQERARTDRERQEDLENRIAAIRGGYLDFVNAMPALEREYQNQLAQQNFQNALQYAQLFGYLPGTLSTIPTPYSYSGLSGSLPNFTGGGGGNAATPTVPTPTLTLAAQNQLLNQALALREMQQAEEANRAALTGRYLPTEAQTMINELLALKQAAERPGVTQSELQQYTNRANQIRQILAVNYGVDPNLIGADVSYSQALQNVATGFPTMERRRFDADEAQRAWENTFAERQFDWQVAQQLWENQFQERNFEQSVREFAQKMGLEWARLNQQERQHVAEMAYKNKALELERQQFEESVKRSNQIDGMSYVQELNSRFLSTDPVSGNRVITDPQGLRNAIIALNLPDEETDKLLIYYGLPVNP